MEASVKPAGPVPIPVPAPVLDKVCCSSLLLLRDILSDREFLVDFGALVLVFPGPNLTSIDEV